MSDSEVDKTATIAWLFILPRKCRKRYESSYKLFKDSSEIKKIASVS